jgi:hypothetical protein
MPRTARAWDGSPNPETYGGYARPGPGYPAGMTHPQNDPDRAGGLVPDAVGEFVAEEPGGAFDPRAFRGDRSDDSDRGVPVERAGGTPDGPPMDGERMSGPGSEIDKAG